MFVNFTNHPSNLWDKEQFAAALSYGEIEDVPFPAVEPGASSESVRDMAAYYADMIIAMKPDYVLCQGEFCMAYNVIDILKERGIRVGAACSERKVTEERCQDGIHKTVVFKFVQFREY